MAKLFNRAKMTTATTGSGTVTLGSAANGFQSFADAGVSDSDVIQYVIEEGSNFEIGTGTYSSSGTTLTRTPIESSESDNSAITLAGGAKVSITAIDDDYTRLQHDGTTKAEAVSSGLSVTGNITVTGTVDGRDLVTDGTKLDGIESGATADQTASEILTAVKTVDGSGSGLDADTLDGNHASAFLTGNETITLSGDVTGSGTTSITASIASNAVGATELNVSGNGSTSQFLRSDGDGTFTWATPTSSGVQSVRLGTRTTISNASDTGQHTWVYTNNGNLMAGYRALWAWGDDMIGGLAQRPVQIQVSGSWSTVSTV